MVGNLFIHAAQKSVFSAISNPLKILLLFLWISKNSCSMLIVRVLPKRRGRVIKATLGLSWPRSSSKSAVLRYRRSSLREVPERILRQ